MNREEKWLLTEKYGDMPSEVFEADRKRLADGEPLAYVIGSQPFLGLTVYLDSRPLIPRPETEWWVEQLLLKQPGGLVSKRTQRDGASQSKFSVENYAFPKPDSQVITFLDLCAGSGAIGCAALKYLPTAQVYFGEIDPAHEPTICKNIRENNLDESRAHIGIGDLFEPFADTKFDVIAVNPPYIPSGRELPPSVTHYEPPQALFAGEDGLAVIDRIAKELPNHLAPDGVAWIECDSEHATTAQSLFKKAGFATKIRNDQYVKPRVLVVSFP